MQRINSKHLMFVIWGTCIVSLKTNISIPISNAGRDIWISVIIASIVILLYIVSVENIMIKSSKFNLYEIYTGALGKILGNIFLLLTALSFIVMLIECAATEASTVHTNLFIETPHWYLLILFVIPAIYSVKKGLVPTIVITIIGMILAMLAGVNLVILTSSYKNYKLLFPILAHGLNMDIIIGAIKCIGYYGGILTFFTFLDFVDSHDVHNIKRFSIIGFLMIFQMQVVSSSGTIVSFGPERAGYLVYPKLIQTQEISYFGYIENGELFVLFQTLGGWFVKYILTFFALRTILRRYSFDNIYVIVSLSLMILVVSYFASSNLLRLIKLQHYYCYFNAITMVLIPWIIFGIYSFRSKKNA
ncbi:endospore germination permease [Clostridium oryzae]|uniref:Spore germination protein n=1 Tax=Clostridium oryzae TaxID=1450648 RepID=A0A1V4IJT4_9CLOT|nr:endospore germination permease [Clostridium oryzae]OPJ60094.1 spore germination protein [Clostridium oryzae]